MGSPLASTRSRDGDRLLYQTCLTDDFSRRSVANDNLVRQEPAYTSLFEADTSFFAATTPAALLCCGNRNWIYRACECYLVLFKPKHVEEGFISFGFSLSDHALSTGDNLAFGLAGHHFPEPVADLLHRLFHVVDFDD